MPRWWVWIFWLSFYYSIGYLVHYHLTGNGASVSESYEAEMAIAREAEAMSSLGGEISEQTLAGLMTKQEIVTDARKLFVLRCAQCHLASGAGGIGPNLTDAAWLHGDASLMSIYQVISDGVQSKGMPSWKRQLSAIELAKLAAFVGSIRNTTLPGKAAEGQRVNSASPQVTP
jgi:cytochrome c oxidase cbb3-type subunit 3